MRDQPSVRPAQNVERGALHGAEILEDMVSTAPTPQHDINCRKVQAEPLRFAGDPGTKAVPIVRHDFHNLVCKRFRRCLNGDAHLLEVGRDLVIDPGRLAVVDLSQPREGPGARGCGQFPRRAASPPRLSAWAA